MSRSKFTRLGDHIARDHAADVRRGAEAGEASALAELEALKAASTPDSLRAKIWEIVRNHLADSDGILFEAGGGPPRSQGRASDAYADALFEWLAQARRRYDFDSPEGRAVEIAGLCAHILSHLDSEPPAFRLGVVLGYALSQKNHLLVREFADGPALARERAGANGRSEGGKSTAAARAENEKRDQARKEFQAKKALDPKLTKRRFAKTFAKQHKLEFETVRDWLKEPRK